ncbi:MAG TPA: protoporphyrinogen oxidase HemJ [Rhizomicrobium sp.]|jgi:putative membrane protein|nr:protoporphyrinogen oxidase HemJ [Rhizomicrobium sp.]
MFEGLRTSLSNYIDWIKAFHVIAVIAWMSGLLYLPRLFVYHTETVPGSVESERFKVMERKLLRSIMNPAAIAVWILGPTLAWLTGAYQDRWLQVKFLLVVMLTVIHHMYAVWRRDFERDANTRSARFYRIWNEVPAVLMVFIVILVIVQPF